MSDESVRVSPVDLRLQVIAIALEPALTLARLAAIPLDDLQGLVEAGYFREARARGMSFRAIARRFGKSLRTVTNLAKRAGEQGLPFDVTRRLAVRRELVARAGRAGASGIGLTELLDFARPEDAAEAEEELAELVAAQILARDGDVVRAVAAHFDMVKEDLGPRLDSLRHLLRGVTMLMHRRFFVVDERAEAFGRVLTFSSIGSDLEPLRSASYAELRQRVLDADAKAGTDGVQATAVFCVVQEPTDPGWTAKRRP